MASLSHAEYEIIVYSLLDQYGEVAQSTLQLYRTSASTGIVEGDITLKNGIRIAVVEVLDFDAARIRKYSYTIYQGGEKKIRWYDPQPHPENAALAATFPHHFHEDPDIKHNRKPAPGISFEAPNLPTLIADCLRLA